MKKGLRELPRDMSATMLALNPHLANGLANAIVKVQPSCPELSKPRSKRKAMNKTESAYHLILMAQVRRGVIDRVDREGVTLRWDDGMTYTADFACYTSGKLTLVEVKGAWIEGDALVKFRAARDKWPMFIFEMQQCKRGSWTRLL